MNIKKIFHLLVASLLIFLIIFFGWMFVDHLGKPYENGRYFDQASDVVYHEQSIWGFGMLLLLSAGSLALLTAWIRKK